MTSHREPIDASPWHSEACERAIRPCVAGRPRIEASTTQRIPDTRCSPKLIASRSRMPSTIPSAPRATSYLAALRMLRFAEACSPTRRRFGSDAEALWKDFAGGLKTIDRIDTLLRDADTQWPGAFGARSSFGPRALAEHDAFGADWESPETTRSPRRLSR
jgi:hypothetical protein